MSAPEARVARWTERGTRATKARRGCAGDAMTLVNGDHLARRSKLVFGAVGAAVLVGGTLVMVGGAVPSHPGATYYTAAFGRAGQGMDRRSDVKVRGVTVGGIERVTLDRSGRAVVRFRVERGIRLPATSSARIEPVSVFGPK